MGNITQLLSRAAAGDSGAVQSLYAELYPEIRKLARSRLAKSGGVTGLDTTSLVHEGFLRMAERENLMGVERLQFFAYVGQALRSVVMDFVRARNSEKRGGGAVMLTLSHADQTPGEVPLSADLQVLDDALSRMRDIDENLYQTVEMHFFAGMRIAEIAEARGVTTRTIDRDLKKARLLLAEILE